MVGGSVQAGVDRFAAGALLAVPVDAMVPAAKDYAGNRAGLAAGLGFAVARAVEPVLTSAAPARDRVRCGRALRRILDSCSQGA